jgi:alpha-L-rhamnosidase
MRGVWQLMSWVGLVICLLPSCLYVLDWISLPAVAIGTLVGTAVWFVSAPFWMGRTAAGLLLMGSLVVASDRQSLAELPELPLQAMRLRCEYLENPLAIDRPQPRLSWYLAGGGRGARQSAYRILVASTPEGLEAGKADLWDSGKVSGGDSLHIPYGGSPLSSRQTCYWTVLIWDADGEPIPAAEPAMWRMGLLEPADWSAEYITYSDETPVHTDRDSLHLPAARQYRKEFELDGQLQRATIYSTALGIYELEVNGSRVGDAYFAPGWTDYHQRAYYRAYDVTEAVAAGGNAIGAWVADGWYCGYVGFGLLEKIGTEQVGRYTYGHRPAIRVQLELEYADGRREVIGSDESWRVTDRGPIREADLLMGEHYDARLELSGWSRAGFDDSDWEPALLAAQMPSVPATFFEFRTPEGDRGGPTIQGRSVDLRFQEPHLEAFPGLPVRITEVLRPIEILTSPDGNPIFNLGQNFAGVVRLRVKGPAGHAILLRHGEMLHPDGRLMTENLRRARAEDTYICRGDAEGEVYEPRFTFHGFQYVELVGFPGEPDLETITGLVLHSDTPMTSEFECSDPMVNQLFSNVTWTQRANFLELPTDCPQRDERMGWTGDAQAYVGTAAYNADIGAFFSKWLRELNESQRPSGAVPGYAPFPFQHGWEFGIAWGDAVIICPWTLWQFYGDTQVIDDSWGAMERFMQWRQATARDDLGVEHGNPWGDWLAQGPSTPLSYIDSVYYAICSRMMAEMAEASGRSAEASHYRQLRERIGTAFEQRYVTEDGRLKVNTQTAYVIALDAGLIPQRYRLAAGEVLADMIARKGNRKATGFLGTRPLLPALSSVDQNDLAVFLLQSRAFPSWGYEIENGATTIWERWDSYTKEDGFGRHNAAMNSFSHYAFGAVCEWMFRTLAGIDQAEPGFRRVRLAPNPPRPGSNAEREAIDWVRAYYHSIRGGIQSDWRLVDGRFEYEVHLPPGVTGEVLLPTSRPESVRLDGRPLTGDHPHVRLLGQVAGRVMIAIDSGSYRFDCDSTLEVVTEGRRVSEPEDDSINPDQVDLSKARQLVGWDFLGPQLPDGWQAAGPITWRPSEQIGLEISSSGDDPQLSVRLDEPLRGPLVISLEAWPTAGAEVEFFWAGAGEGLSATRSLSRPLQVSQQFNRYLFVVPPESEVQLLRFDPFRATGQMRIRRLELWQLAD